MSEFTTIISFFVLRFVYVTYKNTRTGFSTFDIDKQTTDETRSCSLFFVVVVFVCVCVCVFSSFSHKSASYSFSLRRLPFAVTYILSIFPRNKTKPSVLSINNHHEPPPTLPWKQFCHHEHCGHTTNRSWVCSCVVLLFVSFVLGC